MIHTLTTYFLVTLVESSGGYLLSASASVSGNVIMEGVYENCTFDANGGASAFCKKIDYIPTGSNGQLITTTQTFEASKIPFAVLTATPTGSSNAAVSNSHGPYWKMGLYASIICVLLLVA